MTAAPPDPRAIRALWTATGLTGVEIARQIGVSRRTWGNWTDGTRRMPHAAYDMLCRLADRDAPQRRP